MPYPTNYNDPTLSYDNTEATSYTASPGEIDGVQALHPAQVALIDPDNDSQFYVRAYDVSGNLLPFWGGVGGTSPDTVSSDGGTTVDGVLLVNLATAAQFNTMKSLPWVMLMARGAGDLTCVDGSPPGFPEDTVRIHIELISGTSGITLAPYGWDVDDDADGEVQYDTEAEVLASDFYTQGGIPTRNAALSFRTDSTALIRLTDPGDTVSIGWGISW